MASFFDDDDDPTDSIPDLPPPIPLAGPSRPRQPSQTPSTAGSRSFLSRLESTVSPPPPHNPRSYSDRYTSLGLDSVLGDEELGRKDEFGLDGDGRGEEEDDDDDDVELDDVRRMGRVWVRERGTADLMQWEGDLIDGLFDKLEQQQKMVNTLRSDPQTSEEEHFKLVLVQTEMERVKFLIRSYVRTRLAKIEKFSYYIVLSPSTHHLLSGAELQHAKRYTDLLHTHFQHSVLDSLPEWLRKMDDTYGDGLSMVTKPNRNVPVLVYCRKDCGEITLEGGERAALARGTTHLVKYRLVEQWVKLGWAEVVG